eukprot:TRINITY_DN57333_c0_g1_i1.p1 TRINITY_DN57333_c0_g1~~TRINITY_DN57333_c0_g1_i1.p1  ORF type:complete len:607 (-),score=135.52 TRINITY_DN57333_c0_g1_i1:31-1851(-)
MPTAASNDDVKVAAHGYDVQQALAEQRILGDEAEAELQSRSAEKSQLQQLLRHKEQLLYRESLAAGQLRVGLRSTKNWAQYYLALCSLRCWRDIAQRSQARRRLQQAKERRVEAVLRHACSSLAAGLKQASRRRLADTLHELWLNSWVSPESKTPDHVVPAFECTDLRNIHIAKAIDMQVIDMQSLMVSRPQTEAAENDQVLFDTPRQIPTNLHGLATPPQLKRPQLCPSPFSEASTQATSAPTRASALGALRLAMALSSCCMRRIAWSLHRLHAARGLPGSTGGLDGASTKLCLRRAERRCEKLEACLTSELAWRAEAERRIGKMARRGEKLEHERASLLRQCEGIRRRLSATEQRECQLKQALTVAESANEVLNQKALDMETKGSEEWMLAQAERKKRQSGAQRHHKALTETRKEVHKLRARLQVTASREQPESCSNDADAEAACLELRSAWQRERDQWARACDELRRRAETASEEAAAARRAQDQAVTRAISADAQLAAKRDFRVEAETYQRLRSELENRLVRTANLEGKLKAEAAEAVANARGPPLAQEAEAYQALLAKLRNELKRERAERQACDQSLEALRASYSLLLSRVGPVTRTGEAQ